jgi:uncharacterized membrane protein
MLKKARIEALGDGIFAIAMTLLVIDLKSPAQELIGREFSLALLSELPKLGSYLLSFVLLSQCWLAHHAIFHNVSQTTRSFLWVNLALFFTITAVPFSTAVLGQHPRERVAVCLYAGHLALCSLMLLAIYVYTLCDKCINARPVTAENRRKSIGRILIGPSCYGLAIWASFFDVRASFLFLVAAPIIYLLPTSIDRHYAAHEPD